MFRQLARLAEEHELLEAFPFLRGGGADDENDLIQDAIAALPPLVARFFFAPRGGPKAPRLGTCRANRTSQICRCRRECADEGPWECTEEGCPSREVPCSVLSRACRARFSEIWRRPTIGIEGERVVAHACPMSCGMCACARDDFIDPKATPAWLKAAA